MWDFQHCSQIFHFLQDAQGQASLRYFCVRSSITWAQICSRKNKSHSLRDHLEHFCVGVTFLSWQVKWKKSKSTFFQRAEWRFTRKGNLTHFLSEAAKSESLALRNAYVIARPSNERLRALKWSAKRWQMFGRGNLNQLCRRTSPRHLNFPPKHVPALGRSTLCSAADKKDFLPGNQDWIREKICPGWAGILGCFLLSLRSRKSRSKTLLHSWLKAESRCPRLPEEQGEAGRHPQEMWQLHPRQGGQFWEKSRSRWGQSKAEITPTNDIAKKIRSINSKSLQIRLESSTFVPCCFSLYPSVGSRTEHRQEAKSLCNPYCARGIYHQRYFQTPPLQNPFPRGSSELWRKMTFGMAVLFSVRYSAVQK